MVTRQKCCQAPPLVLQLTHVSIDTAVAQVQQHDRRPHADRPPMCSSVVVLIGLIARQVSTEACRAAMGSHRPQLTQQVQAFTMWTALKLKIEFEAETMFMVVTGSLQHEQDRHV